MNKIRVLSLIAAATLAATSIAVHARGGNGGGMGGGAKAGGDLGGRSDSHISSQGLSNTNGPDAADRDKGRARAEDRQEMHSGARHSKAHSQSKKH